MAECTWVDSGICVCNNCGAFASSEEEIIHHGGCHPGDSQRWQGFYNDVEEAETGGNDGRSDLLPEL